MAASVRDKPMHERLAYGKAAEKEIIQHIEKMVGPFKWAEEFADCVEKIDGWLQFPNGTELSVQIKSRQTGDDIAVEVWRDFETETEGRDMKTKADIYIVRSRCGKIFLIYSRDIKDKVFALIEEWDASGSQFDSGWFKGTHGSLKLERGDNSRFKVVAFISPVPFGNRFIEGIPARIIMKQ